MRAFIYGKIAKILNQHSANTEQALDAFEGAQRGRDVYSDRHCFDAGGRI